MAKDWCICNIGTGHAASEKSNILVKISEAVGAGHINDGPGHRGVLRDPIGNLFGHGLGERLDASVASVPADVLNVFIVGHSRGAVLSYMIANALKRARPRIAVRIFNIDPVARYGSGTTDKETVLGNARTITSPVMENDTAGNIPFVGNMFQLTFVKAPGALPIEYIPMPGTHGTATQVTEGNAVGRAALGMALW